MIPLTDVFSLCSSFLFPFVLSVFQLGISSVIDFLENYPGRSVISGPPLNVISRFRLHLLSSFSSFQRGISGVGGLSLHKTFPFPLVQTAENKPFFKTPYYCMCIVLFGTTIML